MAGQANSSGTQGDAGNVVYLSGAGERIAPGAGDDTIGVSGQVLAFNRPATMAFLDAPDSGLLGPGGGGAAVPGALGSLTLFSDPGFGSDLVALPAGGDLPGYALPPGYSFAFDNSAAAGPGAPDALGAARANFQPASVAGGKAMHLPDGTTVTLVDLSQIGTSPIF